MSKRITLILLLSLVALRPVWSQEQVPEIAQVRVAISSGDVDALMKMSAGTIELALLSASRQYTASQATLVLKRFFREYPPTDFNLVESSYSATGVFIEGKMRTSNSATPLRTYIRLNKAYDGWKLRELLIENPER